MIPLIILAFIVGKDVNVHLNWTTRTRTRTCSSPRSSSTQSFQSFQPPCRCQCQLFATETEIENETETGTMIDFPTDVTEEDTKLIREQLGYVPTNLVSVSARRGHGGKGTCTPTPLALKTYPLNGGASRRKAKALGELTPFPTLYWFACPIVGKAIADLERQGYVKIFEERLRKSKTNHNNNNNDHAEYADVEYADSLDQFIQSHRGYANERWHSLLPAHRAYIESRGERMTAMLKRSGIAGTDFESFAPIAATTAGDVNVDVDVDVDKPSIKCLHAHYAHYRSQIENPECDYPLNVVGEWIHAELKRQNADLIL